MVPGFCFWRRCRPTRELASHRARRPVHDRAGELLRRVLGLGTTRELEHVPGHRDRGHRLFLLRGAGVDGNQLPLRVGGRCLVPQHVAPVQDQLDDLRGQLHPARGDDAEVGLFALATRLEGRLQLGLVVDLDHSRVEGLGRHGDQLHAVLVAVLGQGEVLEGHLHDTFEGPVEVTELALDGLTQHEVVHTDLGVVEPGIHQKLHC